MTPQSAENVKATVSKDRATVHLNDLENAHVSAISRKIQHKATEMTDSTTSEPSKTCQGRTQETKGNCIINDSTTQESEDNNDENNDGKDQAATLTQNIYKIVGTEANFQSLQAICPELGPLIRFLDTGEIPTDPKMQRRINFERETHFLDDQKVLWKYKSCTNSRTITSHDIREFRVIPTSLRQDVLELLHNTTHYGIGRMIATLDRCGYQWSGMYKEIKKFVLSCKNCATGKRGLYRHKSLLRPIPTRCMETLHIDIVGPLAISNEGSKYLLTVIDSFSAYIWLFPIKEQTSEIIAEKLLQVFSQVGLPDRLISDLGSPLISETMKVLWKLLHVKHITTAAFNQKANGKLERRHRVISDTLRTLLQTTEIGQWQQHIVLIEWAMRAGSTPTNPFSPSEILHGFPSRTVT